MAEQSQALAKFWWGHEQDGVSDDGMPQFREVLMVTLSVPPLTTISRRAEDQDFETYPEPFKLFEKQNAARQPSVETTGYPLAMWPVIGPANLNMLAAREIYTVERLAELADRGSVLSSAPPELRELAGRAKLMLQMTKDIGQFETQFRDKDGQIAALKEQVEELKTTVKFQNGEIASLRQKAA